MKLVQMYRFKNRLLVFLYNVKTKYEQLLYECKSLVTWAIGYKNGFYSHICLLSLINSYNYHLLIHIISQHINCNLLVGKTSINTMFGWKKNKSIEMWQYLHLDTKREEEGNEGKSIGKKNNSFTFLTTQILSKI